MTIEILPMQAPYIAEAVGLQQACFPDPFPEELLWQPEHLAKHLALFPEGQFVALVSGRVIASSSATRISEANWLSHSNWEETVGGPFLTTFDPKGSTLYGLDISVHPDFRGRGVGRLLYQARFHLVRSLTLIRYGTACRLPDYKEYSATHQDVRVDQYATDVASGKIQDRTMTPLIKCGLNFVGIIHNYMEDQESGNAAALLEWSP